MPLDSTSEYNQILLTTKDGVEVSIIQGRGTYGWRGSNVEVWVKSEEEPVGYLRIEELVSYLQQFVKETNDAS